MKKGIILLFISLLCANVVYAEPTPTIKYLMNEKASLFDIGIIRLEMRFDSFCKSESEYFKSIVPDLSPQYSPASTVLYDWDGNRIIMCMTIFLSSQISFDKLQACSKLIFNLIRTDMGVNYDKGTDLAPNLTPPVVEMFSHQGYQQINAPHILLNELKNIIDITLQFVVMPNKPFYTCKGKLYGTELLFSQ